MIITRLKGGMGNQLFQYALGRKLAHAHQTDLKLDLEEFKDGMEKRPEGLAQFNRQVMLGHFQVACQTATAPEANRLRDRFRYTRSDPLARCVRLVRKWKPGFCQPPSHVREKSYAFDPGVLLVPDNSYLEGFWQSEKYFADVAPLLRTELLFKDQKLVRYAEDYLNPLRFNIRKVVALHVRRGDLAHAQEVLRKPEIVHGNPVGLDYVNQAIARFPKESAFLVFSDSGKDLEWCRQNIRGGNFFFSDGHSDIQDFALMTRCDHNIIANSTFSWWAAWLNQTKGRRVVAPRQWSAPGVPVQRETRDLLLPDWEVL